MNGRYYYFCSGGSIFTVSTVPRRRSRMGKYTKKAKRVHSMEVSSSLFGVRTRARAKQTCENNCKDSFPYSPSSSKPRKISQSTPISSKREPQYMQLRNRRLEKLPRQNVEDKKLAEDGCNGIDLQLANDTRASQDPEMVLPKGIKTPNFELCFIDERLVDMPARNSCSSRPAFVSVGAPSAITFGFEDASYTRVILPAQSAVPAYSQAFEPSKTLQREALVQSAPSQMVTRHLKHDAHSKLAAIAANANVMEMDVHMGTAEVPSPSGNIQRESEVGPCSGESPMIVGPSIRERTQGPSTRSQKRECPPGDLTHSIEGLELPCRTGKFSQARASNAHPLKRLSDALFSTEIEAFLASAEKMERTRFIERYNFDPLTGRPLKGRYLWFTE